MHLSRQSFVFASLFLLLVLLAAAQAAQRVQSEQARSQPAPYSIQSEQPSGTLALQKWLQATGYDTQALADRSLAALDRAQVLFIFEPVAIFDRGQIDSITNWVRGGHTLILASEHDEELMRSFGFRIARLDHSLSTVPIEQPLRGQPGSLVTHVPTRRALTTDRTDYVALLSATDGPLLVRFREGRGTVWIIAAPYLFTNVAIGEDANADLVKGMLSDAPPGALTAFDEYHLHVQVAAPATLQALLFGTAWGWAILYAALILAVYLVLNGRRFGRPVPLPHEIERRDPAEYIVALAQLLRRAGKRAFVLHHYRRQLKRALGKPYGLDADLADDVFVSELARYRDDSYLLPILQALGRPEVDEKTLVRLASQAVELARAKS